MLRKNHITTEQCNNQVLITLPTKAAEAQTETKTRNKRRLCFSKLHNEERETEALVGCCCFHKGRGGGGCTVSHPGYFPNYDVDIEMTRR